MTSVIFLDDANSGFQAGTINGSVNTEFHHHAPPEPQETPPNASIVIPFSRDRDFVKRGIVLDQIYQNCVVLGSWTALVGLGGVGKSQLAIEYAYRTQDKLPGTWVFWVHASNAARFEQSFQDIADKVKIAGRRDPKANIFKLVHDWLHDEKNGRWLVILDNVDDAHFLEAKYPSKVNESDSRASRPLCEYLPRSPNGSILVTTRDREAALKLVEYNSIISINPMDKKQAGELFSKRLAPEVQRSDEDATELVAALEFMPLAIVQAAAYISQRAPRCSVRQYIEEFQRSDLKKMRLLSHEGGHLRRDLEAKNSILVTWQISFQHIRQFNSSAADLLSLMSFFDRQGVPDSLLRCYKQEADHTHLPEVSCPHGANTDVAISEAAWSEELNRDDLSDRDRLSFNGHNEVIDENWSELGHEGSNSQDSLSDWSEDYNNDEEDIEENSASALSLTDDFESDIATLRNYSFISCTVRPGSFDMHRLVQLATQQWLETDGQLERWRQQFIINLCMEFPPAEYEDWGKCQVLYPHATLAVAQQPSEKRSLILWASLLHKSAWYASKAGNVRDARAMSLKALKARQKLFGQEHDETLRSMEMLGSVLLDEGRREDAEELQRRVMDTRKRVHGPGHPLTLASVGNLALTLLAQRRWDEAEVLQVQKLEHLRSALGVMHPDTLNSMANLSSTYIEQSQLKDAEELLLQVIDTSKKILGADHPETLNGMENLAETYRDQGREDEAEKLKVQVIEIRKKKHESSHPETLNSMASLALTYRNQGRWDAAEELEVQVLNIRKNKLGADHLYTLTSMANLASTYREQGRWDAAEELQLQVLKIRKKKLGADHLDTLNSMTNLASTYWKQGRWDAAEELEVQVLNIHKKKLGADHLYTLKSMANLASTYREQGRLDAAEELQLQVLKIHKKLGADRLVTLNSMTNLASTYWNQGRCDAAEELEVQVLNIHKKKLGADHLYTLTSMANLASTYREQGRWDAAEELQVQVIEIYKKKLGADHLYTLTSMANLALTYREQGRWDIAKELQLQVMEKYKKKLGANHPDTLTTMYNLALMWEETGSETEAVSLMEECVQSRKRVLGLDHPATLLSSSALAAWKAKQEDIVLSV